MCVFFSYYYPADRWGGVGYAGLFVNSIAKLRFNC